MIPQAAVIAWQNTSPWSSIDQEVIDRVRGQHPDYVFTFREKPIERMMNNGWKRARKIVGLPQVRVHDLKHTFGRRLRAAGVSFEDRQDLLGHKSSRVTTHYSAAELRNLIDAANKVTQEAHGPALTVLRAIRLSSSRKSLSGTNFVARNATRRA